MRFIGFFLFFYFLNILVFCEELDIEYYNIELRIALNSKKTYNFLENLEYKKDEKTFEFLRKYFYDYYSYYEYYIKLMKDIDILKKELFYQMNIPNGLNVKVYWDRKKNRFDYEIYFKFKFDFDLEKIVKGDGKNGDE